MTSNGPGASCKCPTLIDGGPAGCCVLLIKTIRKFSPTNHRNLHQKWGKQLVFSLMFGNSLRSSCFPILDTPTFLYRYCTVVVGQHPAAVAMNKTCSLSTRIGQRFYGMLE